MIEHESESEFDDPGFKAAVQRTIGRETAPSSLRIRVQALMAAEAAAAVAGHGEHGSSNGELTKTAIEKSPTSSPSPARRGWLTIDRSSWRVVAAAACLLIAIGFMGYQIREYFFPPSPYAGGAAGAPAVPTTLVAGMTKTHDNCSNLPDHHKIPGDDPVALKDKLTAGAGVTASAINLGSDWTFKGAGICKVGDKDTAHLLFVRADEYVSLFSMTTPEECGYGSEEYREVYEKHVVTGFRNGGGLYCLVGSSTTRAMTKDELNPLLTKVRESVVMGRISHQTMLAAATASAHRDP